MAPLRRTPRPPAGAPWWRCNRGCEGLRKGAIFGLARGGEVNTLSAHEDFSGRDEAKASSERSFGLVFAVVLGGLALWPLLEGAPPRWWLGAPAALFLVAALVRPGVLAPLNRVWTRLGLILHRLTNPLVMAVIFYLAVTPTALVLRLFGKDPLRRRFEPEAESYWIERRPPGPAPESMRHQF